MRQRIQARTRAWRRMAKSCGPGAATVASICGRYPADNGDNKRRSPGRARISRKTIAWGRPGCLGCTCSVCPCASARGMPVYSAHGIYGRNRRPAFPAPSLQERDNEYATARTKSCRENAKVCLDAPSTTPSSCPGLTRASTYFAGAPKAWMAGQAQSLTSLRFAGRRKGRTTAPKTSPQLTIFWHCGPRHFSFRNGRSAGFRQPTVNGFGRGLASQRVWQC